MVRNALLRSVESHPLRQLRNGVVGQWISGSCRNFVRLIRGQGGISLVLGKVEDSPWLSPNSPLTSTARSTANGRAAAPSNNKVKRHIVLDRLHGMGCESSRSPPLPLESRGHLQQ